MDHKKKILLLGTILLIITLLYLCLDLNANSWRYALSRRIPRVFAILLTGGGIAFSSVVFQTITNNRILTPSVLGLDSLYLFTQTLVVFILGSNSFILLSAEMNFVVSVSAMVGFSTILYVLFFKKQRENIYYLLLIGIIFSTLFSSLASFMQMLIDPNEFHIVQDRMFASFNNVNTDLLTISFFIFIAAGIYTFPLIKQLDVLSLGRDHAINLGVNYDKVIKRLLIVIVILVAVSTALVGPITFLGILVANLAREILTTYKHKYIISMAVIISGLALIGGQLVSERILNLGVPISVIVNFAGGIYFIYLLLKGKTV
ncbi:iron chelate uptake ABC transporter family permease subunit [Proteinivorax tanatarense]|uniref:Iron chelate uptake ABC transporter family permease subunit n=1 Tax=Proteinivorax tanatarense TaxID=1260629 RepID=A0AAU7VML9_9FIRM